MRVWATVAGVLASEPRCALVSVARVRGSAPREAGARMVVREDGGFHGTVGGGALEWQAIADARAALQEGPPLARLSRHALGPDLAQCCGGSVDLLLEVFDRSRLDEVGALAAREARGPFLTEGLIEAQGVRRRVAADAERGAPAVVLEGRTAIRERFAPARRDVFLFGAGHVGRAVMLALAPLPFAVTWVDERDGVFPAALPDNVVAVRAPDTAGALAAAPAGAFVVVMTHSHPLDLAVVHAALAAGRFPYVGLIGSASKRARFVRRLREAGLGAGDIGRLRCPIGIDGIHSKLPAAIAAAVAAELIIRDESAPAAGAAVPEGATAGGMQR